MNKALFLALASTAFLSHAQERRIEPRDRGRRVALVIGNDDYPWNPLRNAVNDAQAVAKLLPQLGFASGDITIATNTKLKEMQRVTRAFIEKLRSDDVAFVYYSGHGMEIRGENFLVPVDFPPNATELEARDESYSAQQLLRSLEETNARVRLMFLDAGRDNPLRPTRSGSGGLGRRAGQGTLIVFATGAGQTAADNLSGTNGLFTSYLLKALPTPGVPIDQLIKQVARDVHRVREKQTPAIYGLLYEDFTFVAGKAPVPANTCGDGWAMVKESNDVAVLSAFTQGFGECASELRLANLRLKTLERRPPGAVSRSSRGVARLTLLAGHVSVRRGDNGEAVAAAPNAPLLGDDHILTGRDARAEIQFDYDHFVRLSSNAELRLADIENHKYLVRLARGTMTFRVRRDNAAKAEISTPSIAIRPLKSGSYRVSVLEDGTTEVTVRSGEAEIITSKGSRKLKSGKTLIARGDFNDGEFQLANAPMTDEWDRWNEARDRQVENGPNYNYK